MHLNVSIRACLSICLFLSLYAYLCVCLSVCLSEGLTLETSALYSLRWPIYIFNLVDITKLPCYPHRRSTTVSLEAFTLYSFVCLSACLSVSLSVYLSICQPVCLFIFLSAYLSVYEPVCLSVSLSVYLSVLRVKVSKETVVLRWWG